MTAVNDDDLNRAYARQTEEVTPEEVEAVVDQEEAIRDKFSRKHGLKRYLRDAVDLLALIKDYRRGTYRNVAWKTVALVVAALLYVLNPIDIIPDFIPIAGLLDDAVVMSWCLAAVSDELDVYRQWKQTQ